MKLKLLRTKVYLHVSGCGHQVANGGDQDLVPVSDVLQCPVSTSGDGWRENDIRTPGTSTRRLWLRLYSADGGEHRQDQQFCEEQPWNCSGAGDGLRYPVLFLRPSHKGNYFRRELRSVLGYRNIVKSPPKQFIGCFLRRKKTKNQVKFYIISTGISMKTNERNCQARIISFQIQMRLFGLSIVILIHWFWALNSYLNSLVNNKFIPDLRPSVTLIKSLHENVSLFSTILICFHSILIF